MGYIFDVDVLQRVTKAHLGEPMDRMIESNVPPWFDRVGGVAWRIVAIAVAVAILIAGTVALTSIIVPVVLGLLFACGLHPLSQRLRVSVVARVHCRSSVVRLTALPPTKDNACKSTCTRRIDLEGFSGESFLVFNR